MKPILSDIVIHNDELWTVISIKDAIDTNAMVYGLQRRLKNGIIEQCVAYQYEVEVAIATTTTIDSQVLFTNGSIENKETTIRRKHTFANELLKHLEKYEYCKLKDMTTDIAHGERLRIFETTLILIKRYEGTDDEID